MFSRGFGMTFLSIAGLTMLIASTFITGFEHQIDKMFDREMQEEFKKIEEKARRQYPIRTTAFSPDGQTLAWGREDGIVVLWDVAHQEQRSQLSGCAGQIRKIIFDPQGEFLVAAGGEYMNPSGSVVVWDLSAVPRPMILEEGKSPIRTMALSDDGRALAATSGHSRVNVYNMSTRQRRGSLPIGELDLFALDFSPDGKVLAGAGERGIVTLWDSATLEVKQSFKVATDTIKTLAFSPDGSFLAVGSDSRDVLLIDSQTGKEITRLHTNHGYIRSLVFNPEDRRLIAAGCQWNGPGELAAWEIGSWKNVANLQNNNDGFFDVSIHPDGHMIATGSMRQRVELRNTLNAPPLFQSLSSGLLKSQEWPTVYFTDRHELH